MKGGVFVFKTIKFLFKKIREYDFPMIPIMIFYTILSSIYPFIWVVVPAKLISLVASADYTAMIKFVTFGGILSVVCVMGTSYLRGSYRMRMNKVRYNFIRDLMNYSLTMPYENTLDPEQLTKMELADRSISNPIEGAGGIILTMLSLFGNIFASIGFLGLVSTLSWGIMIFLFVLVLLSFYFNSKSDLYEESSWIKKGDYGRRYFQTTNIMMDPSYGKDIRLYSLIDLLIAYCDNLIHEFKLIGRSIAKKRIQMDGLVAILNIIRDITIFTYISILLFNNRIDASQFFLYISGTSSLVIILQEAMRQISSIRKESNRFSHFITLMEENRPELKNDVNMEELEEAFRKREIRVDIVDLSFKYPRSDEKVLEDLNLTIRAGEKIAIVGDNGSGKTTLIKLLCKFYRPDSGGIYLNGIDIKEIPEEIYWEMIGVAFQDAMVFPFSIGENITLGQTLDENKIERVVKDSGIKETIEDLPRGINTKLLRILDDDGLDISGGQRQKLYLARALYKGSKLLILDEPTAALDPLAEAQLYEQYNMLSKGRTSIYISHRLASTKFCDRIAYLKDGKIAELGTHDELMNLEADYKALFDIQAKYYRKTNQEEILYGN